MGKRGNEHQLTKDDFDADVEKSSVESPGTLFAKATPDELAKRRIIRSAKR